MITADTISEIKNKVITYIPGARISCRKRYDGYTGNSLYRANALLWVDGVNGGSYGTLYAVLLNSEPVHKSGNIVLDIKGESEDGTVCMFFCFVLDIKGNILYWSRINVQNHYNNLIEKWGKVAKAPEPVKEESRDVEHFKITTNQQMFEFLKNNVWLSLEKENNITYIVMYCIDPECKKRSEISRLQII